jgi:hypothetical protein
LSAAPASRIRIVLATNTFVSGATGLVLLLGATLLDSKLGATAQVIVSAGFTLLAFSVLTSFVTTRRRLTQAALMIVIIGDLLWAIASAVTAADALPLPGVSPTAAGVNVLIALAVIALAFAGLLLWGWRKARLAA